MLFLTLKLRIWIEDSQVDSIIGSFARLGFTARFTLIGQNTEIKKSEYDMVCTTDMAMSLNRQSWCRLFERLTSLSPISLSLTFSGLSEQEWTSPVSSLGTLFLANTYLQEIDEGISRLTEPRREGNSVQEKTASSRLSLEVEYARRKYRKIG